MTTRTISRVALGLAIVGLALLIGRNPDRQATTPSAKTASGPPNVILLTIDTLRRDHVGAYGYGRRTTPHIDAFFARGTTFLHATSPAPCTVLAVRQVLTGMRDFDDQRPRLTELLHDAGYRTAAFVSQHQFRDEKGPRTTYSRGFDLFDVQGAAEVDANQMTSRTPTEVSNRAIDWLAARTDDAPLFLWLHYFDPHDPYEPPDSFRVFPDPAPAVSGDRRGTLRQAMKKALQAADKAERAEILSRPNPHAHFGDIYGPEEVESLRGRYDGEILYVDAQVQRVLETLEAKGVLDDALVILTSDHGERLGGGGRWAHCQSLHAYEINVPLLVYRSGGNAASRIEAAVTTLDVYPTVLAAAGIPDQPAVLDGRDLFSVDADRTVYSVWENEHAIQDSRFKLVTDLRGDTARSALYDLSADPTEQNDVLGDHPAQAAELGRAMAAYEGADEDVLRRIDDTLERLRAIGYVE